MEKTLFTKDYEVLLDLLKETRQEAGVTQVEIAEYLETTQSIISKCERSERRLDVIELRKWCQAMGISFVEFLMRFESRLNSEKPRIKRRR